MINKELWCCCEYCNDGDGNCIYPYYGLAPHTHDINKTSSMIGSTEIEDEDKWPENFAEDCEVKGLGTYTHCIHCGRPNDEKLFYQDRETRDKRANYTT